MAHSVSSPQGQSCKNQDSCSKPNTNNVSNNVITSSIATLSLDQNDYRSLLSSPQSYLAKQSPSRADHIRSVLIPAYKRGFRIIFIIGASLAAVAFFLACWLIPQVELKRPDDDALKEEGTKRVRGERDEEKRG